MKNLTPLHDVQSLDAAIAESLERPVLLFKHSRYCGVSCEALDELQAHIESRTDPTVAYKMITVQTHRPVSDAASQRLGCAMRPSGDPPAARSSECAAFQNHGDAPRPALPKA